MSDSHDDARALLDAYAEATAPSPAAIERSLTRTLARIESEPRPAKLPDPRRRFAWVAAASVAALVLASAALAGVRWYRSRPQPEPQTYGAAQFDRVDERGSSRTTVGGSANAPRPRPAPELEPTTTIGPAPTIEPEPAPAPEPTVEAVAEQAKARREPERAHRNRSKQAEAPSDAEPAEAPVADASVLAEESRLLARARRTLRDDDFEAALEWIEEHARRHPHGSLSEERLILEAVAACRHGEVERGKEAAKRLRAQFPKTAALAKVERACASD